MSDKKIKNNLDNLGNKLRLVIKSGKFSLGYNTTIKSLREGKCKFIVIANNCTSTRRLELEYYAMLNKCPVNHFYGNNSDLGISCGKAFRCSCIGIIDPGDADISNFINKN
nr:60S ribosomal protein L30 [Cryptomonas curvata]|mmetsp:Transcript_4635/g.10266  ORF Transcript_4635/g.10266 Transcript_4635/m.10266 type:complete len:111 (+) Transcript_4635:357-689(+)